MGMTTYWDLGEEERGNLSEEDVERFVDAELMTKGVLRVRDLELVPAEPMPEPTTTVFVVRARTGNYAAEEVAFRSRDAAARFVDLVPAFIGSSYINGESVRYVSAPEASEIIESKYYTRDELERARAAVEKSTAAKQENEKRRAEYDKACKAQKDALTGLWEDWHRCREIVSRLAKVRATFEDYKRIAGSESVAATFLGKVFSAQEIEAAIPSLRPA